MNIDNLTYGELKQIANMFADEVIKPTTIYNGMIGKYVIVRCHDAGVHAGVLQSHAGREAILTSARRLWYWKPAGKAKYLCGVANHGLDESSKVGGAVQCLHLTETCEIIECSVNAKKSILEIKVDER